MENIITLPIDTVINVSLQIWNLAGVPMILGIATTWIVQKAKISPSIPFIESARPWIVRGFVVVIGTVLQIGVHLVAGRELGWDIVQQIVLTYFTASTAYTHLFKPGTPS